MEQPHDELGRPLRLERVPPRIVSLVPSLTEWLFAIGAGPRIAFALGVLKDTIL